MSEQLKDWRVWAKGLLAAAISSAANGITVALVDPQNFNFGEGLYKLGSVIAASAIVGIALYLAKSPLP